MAAIGLVLVVAFVLQLEKPHGGLVLLGIVLAYLSIVA